MDLALLAVALLGHGLLWIAVVNRLHGTGVPRRVQLAGTLVCAVAMTAIAAGYGWWYVDHSLRDSGHVSFDELPLAMWPYLALCWVSAVVGVGWWIWRAVGQQPPSVLRFHRTRVVELAPHRHAQADPAAPAGEEHDHHYLVRLPKNQVLKLDLSQRAIEVPRLPSALDGLSIAHLSDFHFTGRVGKAYFREVVRHSNELQPDLVALTGDLVDREECIDWIPDTLGQLTARYGVYYILGNHDMRVDMDRLRDVLHGCGLIDLGGRWLELEVRGERIVLAGNELPWLVPAADMTRCPRHTESGGPLRIVLSHSPDQLDWARAQDADLMLAGHTHGGQIQLPLIGPILAPSRMGVRYASGLFYAPPTIMHVTRGVSGEFPVRLNCPPEMAHLVLHAGKQASSAARRGLG